MQRGKAMELGGFLTGRVRSKLLDEYAGPGKSTIGEDMEMIVRLHRFERENGRAAKIAHSPLPVCWTEAPSTWRVLGRQRRRWHRGFLEILSYHGRMFLDPAYGRIGLLSIPYLVFFEFLGPYIEALGYVLLPILALLGLLDYGRAALVVAVALGFGVLHSTVAVLCATWLEPVVPGGTRVRSLMGMDAWRSRLLLLAACFLGETGYRQATVWWRLHGTWEFLRGVQSWGAMERKGFRTAAAGGAVAAVALLAAPSAACGADGWAPSAWTLGGLELRDGATPGSWAEAGGRWDETAAEERTGRAAWVGAFRIARRDDADGGLFAGGSLRPGRWGFAVEARVAPGAAVSSRWLLSCEGEALVRAPVAAAWTLRWSDYRDASVADLGTGTVLYLPNDAWLAVRAHLTRTTWSGGEADDVTGGTVTLHLPVGRTGLRLSASTGAESYLAGVDPEPRRLRATAAGLTTRVPIGSGWVVESGAAGRRPERGENDLYLHAGLRRRW
jgi:YaiO family outer membrane protein